MILKRSKAKPKSAERTAKNSHRKKLTNEISKPKFRARFRPIEIAIILVVIIIGIGGIMFQKHEQKIHEQLNATPTSSQSSQDTQSSPALSTNTPTQPIQSSTTASPSDSSDTNCTDETIQFTATSEDSASLPAGQTQVVGTGKNGYNVVCNGKIVKTVQPFNIIVVTGTGASTNLEPSTITPTQPNMQPYSTPAPSPISVEQNGNYVNLPKYASSLIGD